MRKLLVALFALLAFPAFAQYVPPPYQTGNSAVAFQPTAKTALISASGTSANLAITTSLTGQVQVYNSTSATAFIIFCATSSCTASVGSAGTSTSDYPIGAGAVIVLSVPAGTTFVAVVLSTSTGSVYFTPGVGL